MSPSSEQTDSPGAGSRWKPAVAVVVLALATVAAYRSSFAGVFLFDDVPSILDNPTIRPPWSLAALLSPPPQSTAGGRPLVNLTLALNYALGANDPWSYHALNLLIHLLAGLTLFGIVRRTLLLAGGKGQSAKGISRSQSSTGPATAPFRPLALCAYPLAPSQGEATGLAFAVTLLWTLHPLQTESVTYIIQRTESLMGLCYLLTLYCFVRAVAADESAEINHQDPETPSRSAPSQHSVPLCLRGSTGIAVGWFTLSILCCLLGMASKEVMVSAPVMVLLYDRTFLAGTFREAWRRRKGVYIGLAATWLLLGGLVFGIGGNRGGTSGPGSGASLGAYALTQAPAVMDYLLLSFWPHPLVFDHGAEWVKDWTDVFLPGVAVIVLVAGTVWALRRRLALGFLGAWFFSILAPTSLVPGPRQTMADHRMYLALAAVIAVVVCGLHACLGRPRDHKTTDHGTSRAGGLVVCLLAVVFGWLTAARNGDYRSDFVIWGDTVAKRPDNRWAQCNFGMALCDLGRAAEALPHLERGLRLDPTDPLAHNDLGMALAKLGRLDEAVQQYEAALRIKPDLSGAHSNLGLLLSEMNRPQEALPHLETAIRLKPGLATAHYNLGLALARVGRHPEAVERFREAIRLNPGDAAACASLGGSLAQTGQAVEAIQWLERATDLDPNDATAQFNLAMMLARTGQYREAVRRFQAVLRLRPNDLEAQNALLQLQGLR